MRTKMRYNFFFRYHKSMKTKHTKQFFSNTSACFVVIAAAVIVVVVCHWILLDREFFSDKHISTAVYLGSECTCTRYMY